MNIGPGLPRRRRGAGSFMLRWSAAVASSVLVAGLAQYALSTWQVERRVLQESLEMYAFHVEEVEDVLAAQLSPSSRQVVLQDHLDHLLELYGTQYAGLFDEDGELIAATDGDKRQLDDGLVREVLVAQRPVVASEDDPGEAVEGRFQFLFPVTSPTGTLFLEVDREAEIVRNLTRDLSLTLGLGIVMIILTAVPLSYVLGGRSLGRRHEAAQREADTDPLTGIPGRRPFRPLLQAELANPTNAALALALIDLDHLKQLNDRLGHSHGDRVLVALAESFATLRATDSAFRLGGDEFAVVLPGVDDRQAAAVIDRVRDRLAETMPGVTFSCGVASSTPADRVERQELWERADAALYESKRLGRHRTTVFSGIRAQVTVGPDKLDAVHRLLADESGLTVAFQPIWDLRTGGLLGHEALLRLPAGLPLQGPGEAFDLAQRLDVAAELDRRARAVALAAVARRSWHGLLFLNVHPDALRTLDVDVLRDEVRDAGLAPEDVVLEVTEHAGMDGAGDLRALRKAKARGFRLALDDLGQGNSGLRALTWVRFDVIKLDRSVVAGAGLDPACDATIAAATTFALQTGGWIIAEGIEQPSALEAVLGQGTPPSPTSLPVLAGQGYLLGRPGAEPVQAGVGWEANEPVPTGH